MKICQRYANNQPDGGAPQGFLLIELLLALFLFMVGACALAHLMSSMALLQGTIMSRLQMSGELSAIIEEGNLSDSKNPQVTITRQHACRQAQVRGFLTGPRGMDLIGKAIIKKITISAAGHKQYGPLELAVVDYE